MLTDDLLKTLRQNARHLRSGGSRFPPEGKQFDMLFDEAADQLEKMLLRANAAEMTIGKILDVLGVKR